MGRRMLLVALMVTVSVLAGALPANADVRNSKILGSGHRANFSPPILKVSYVSKCTPKSQTFAITNSTKQVMTLIQYGPLRLFKSKLKPGATDGACLAGTGPAIFTFGLTENKQAKLKVTVG
jgi:hypothetical protein